MVYFLSDTILSNPGHTTNKWKPSYLCENLCLVGATPMVKKLNCIEEAKNREWTLFNGYMSIVLNGLFSRSDWRQILEVKKYLTLNADFQFFGMNYWSCNWSCWTRDNDKAPYYLLGLGSLMRYKYGDRTDEVRKGGLKWYINDQKASKVHAGWTFETGMLTLKFPRLHHEVDDLEWFGGLRFLDVSLPERSGAHMKGACKTTYWL